MDKEFGIACILEKTSTDEIIKYIPFLEKNNYPHISLFQFRCDDKKFLSSIKEYLKKVLVSKEFLTGDISLVEENVFLNIVDDSTLKYASDQLAEFYSENCYCKEPLSQINFTELNSEQTELVNKYGIYWVKQNFHPHITLSYNRQTSGIFNVPSPLSLKVRMLDLYPIDTLGRINI